MEVIKRKESNEVYQSSDAVSRSMLHLISQSPQHYKYVIEHPTKQTPALAFGSAFHCFLLEPEVFENEYDVVPDIDRRTREGKRLWEELQASNKKLITQEDFLIIQQMAVSVFSNPYAVTLLRGEKEMSYYLKKTDKYGTPLDNRATYTKSDWILWCATMAETKEQAEEMIRPVANYLENTSDRIPFGDWYDVESGKYYMFIARSVQGGIFMPMLFDKSRKI